MKQIESTLTKKQIFLSRICFCVGLILYGILLLLASFGLFNAPFNKLILPLLMLILALISIILAFIQQNTLLFWLSPVFLAVFLMLALKVYFDFSILKTIFLLPLSFSVGSLFSLLYSKILKDHIKVIMFFLPLSFILMIFSLIDLQFKLVISILIIYVAILMLIYVLTKGVKK